jgi:hypothetical protein
MLVLNESLTVNSGGKTMKKQVIPISYDEYTRIMSKPYKEPLRF